MPQHWEDDDPDKPDWYRPPKPYEARNLAAVTHGTRSEAVKAAKNFEIRSRLMDEIPILTDPMFVEAFDRCVEATVIASMLGDWIFDVIAGLQESRSTSEKEERPTTGVEAVPKHIWDAYDKAQKNAAKFAQDCGLDPIGFARLAKELGWAKQLAGNGLENLRATGAAIRQGRLNPTAENSPSL